MASPPPTPAFQSVYPPVLASITKPGGGVTDSMRMWMQQVSATLPNGGAFALNQFITNIFNLVSGNFNTTLVTLTNAQVKALPSTPVNLVAAQGAGTLIVPFAVDVIADFTAAGYTNINADSSMAFGLVSRETSYSAFILNDSTIPTTFLTMFLGIGHWHAGCPLASIPQPLNGWGTLPFIDAITSASFNSAFQIFCDNGGSGNFTGGNAANTVSIRTWYVVH